MKNPELVNGYLVSVSILLVGILWAARGCGEGENKEVKRREETRIINVETK